MAIIGAGAAGIAAARKVAAAGRRYVLLEASDRIGGRCVTDTGTFGVPYDRGAHWLHVPGHQSAGASSRRAGFEVYPAPPGQKLRIGKRNAREGEMEDYLATVVRANRAIQDAARGKADVRCMQALPKDLGDWRPAVEFVLGPFGCGKNLDEISAVDFARSVERDVDAYCRQGLGALVAKLGSDLPVQLRAPVHAHAVDAQFRRDGCRRAASSRRAPRSSRCRTACSRPSKIKFMPDLPPRHRDAIAKLSLGSYDHVALELKGNPLQVQQRRSGVREGDRARSTAALLANVSGTPLAWWRLRASSARSWRKGEAAMIGFRDRLARRSVTAPT